MQSPLLSLEELLDYLKSYGWAVASKDFEDSHGRWILQRGETTIPLKLSEKYGFPKVVKLCESLSIPAPADHQRNYDQLRAGIRQWELEKQRKANEQQ
jgi:hypothetical protein